MPEEINVLKQIEEELMQVKTFFDDLKNEVSLKDIYLGTMTERDQKLYTLAHDYRKKEKHIKATIMLVEDNDDSERLSLHERRVFYNRMAELISDIMWTEIKIRHSDLLKKTEHNVVSLRKGKIIIAGLSPRMPKILTELFGMGEIELP